MELSARQGDGASLRTHLQRACINTGRADPLLDEQSIAPCVRAVWDAYLNLSATRRTGMGLAPLALTDIDAWQRLTGVRLTPWELDTLIQLDAACLAVLAKQQGQKHH